MEEQVKEKTTRRPSFKWEDNIKKGLTGKGCELDTCGCSLGPVAGSCEHAHKFSRSMK
jgi:hypothetical protein